MTRPPLWQKAPDGSLDTTATFKVLCIYLTMGVFLFIGIGAFTSLIYQWQHEGASLDPSEAWRSVLNSILLFLAAAFGISYAAGIGKAAMAPKVAEADVVRKVAELAPPSGDAATTTSPPTVVAQLGALTNRQPSKTDDESMDG
jgi:hypothetical protein